MEKIKVIFMGTPEFSVPIVKEISKIVNLVLVVTSPDAYVGRKKVLTPCAVKQWALDNNIDVFSPDKLRNNYEIIKTLNPDLIITCAYGQIVPEEVLNIPRLGCINIHASLLPKYRGASPIQSVILNGEKETGITLMYMDKHLDTGDIICKSKISILDNDNYATLSDKLSNLGAKLIVETLPVIIAGKNDRIPQNNAEATYVGLIKREDEHINFNDTALNIHNKIRAFSPSPYANFILDDKEYKVVEAYPIEIDAKDADKAPGTIISETKNSIIIKALDEGIMIIKLKPVGKNVMNVSDFKNGYQKNLIGRIVK